MAEVADVADVLCNGEVGIEAERLGEVAGLRSRFARRAAENLRAAGSCFHHAREDLKRSSLSGSVRADESEDFAGADFEIEAADRLNGAVVFAELADVDGGRVGFVWRRPRGQLRTIRFS